MCIRDSCQDALCIILQLFGQVGQVGRCQLCQMCIRDSYNVMPIGLLPICAGMAVREGMDYQQALACCGWSSARCV